jgi:hypothetical protein
MLTGLSFSERRGYMFIIDRIEGSWAVIECEGETFNLPRKLIPGDAREGDVIQITVGIDHQATNSRSEKMKKLIEEVFED